MPPVLPGKSASVKADVLPIITDSNCLTEAHYYLYIFSYAEGLINKPK